MTPLATAIVAGSCFSSLGIGSYLIAMAYDARNVPRSLRVAVSVVGLAMIGLSILLAGALDPAGRWF